MIKKPLSLFLAIVLLLSATPALAMQPVNAPGASPAPQAMTLGGKNAPYFCLYRPQHAELLEQTTVDQWKDWIEKLSGAEPVSVGGIQRTINNRHSYALFNRTDSQYAMSYGFDYLVETVRAWEPDVHVEVDPYQPWGNFTGETWKNLIVTIPGTVAPQEVVLLTAHFDSTNGGASVKPLPGQIAPGADDNASGSASLLEAARILKDAPLDRTVRMIWFTGEEQVLWGSGAYTSDHDLSNVVGVINLDMYAYDSNDDRCFELHVSNSSFNPFDGNAVPASERIGACFVNAIDAYIDDVDLKYDYVSGNATSASDHRSFWLAGVGAIEVLENYHTDNLPGGCTGSDMSVYYHKEGDTVQTINFVTGFAIHRAALATLFSMATIPERSLLPYRQYLPVYSESQQP